MATQQPARPQQGTGLPPGVEVGPLGARFVAYLIDSLVPWVLGLLFALVLPGLSGAPRTVLSVIFVLVIVAWAVLVWRGIALTAASPGLRIMSLQVVGFYNGRPIGWGRTFVRGLILWLLSVTGIGLLLLVAVLLVHPRKQGWHDLAAKAVVIKARALAPAPRPSVEAPAAQPAAAQPATASPYAEVLPGEGADEYAVEEQPQAPGDYRSPAYEAHSPAASEYRDAATGDWLAELDDGREIAVDGLVLLGRNPQPQPGEEDAQLIKLADETRTVSKSHLAIGLDGDGVYVVDLGSTNGSTVTTPEGDARRVQPGDVVYVVEDSIVSLGDHWLRIRRGSV